MTRQDRRDIGGHSSPHSERSALNGFRSRVHPFLRDEDGLEYYFAFTMAGGCQVPSPGGSTDGASVFGQ